MAAIITINGRLGRDPEPKMLGNSQAANFSIGVRTNQKGQDGNYISNWYECTAWGKTAEIVLQYAKKGTQVLVYGDLCCADYTSRDGQQKYALRVRVDKFELLGSSNGNSNGGNNTARSNYQAQPQVQTHVEDDDDLPF